MQRPDSLLVPPALTAGASDRLAASAPRSGLSRPPRSEQTQWSTVAQTAIHFCRSEWFIRKTANEMSQLRTAGHPIKAGGGWLIDIDAMTAYFAFNAEKAASRTRYPTTEADANARHVGKDEDWRWG
jgi:hypothetical protein